MYRVSMIHKNKIYPRIVARKKIRNSGKSMASTVAVRLIKKKGGGKLGHEKIVYTT